MNEHAILHDHGYYADGCKIGLETISAPAEADMLKTLLHEARAERDTLRKLERALREIVQLWDNGTDGFFACPSYSISSIAREALKEGEAKP